MLTDNSAALRIVLLENQFFVCEVSALVEGCSLYYWLLNNFCTLTSAVEGGVHSQRA